jgi:ligand-binding sensor domain-containing protein
MTRPGERPRRFRKDNSKLLDDRVNCLCSHAGTLWVGTCAGINIWNGRSFEAIVASPGGLAGNIFHCIREDPNERVWVGTTGQGISVYSKGRWQTFGRAQGLNNDWINDVAFTSDGDWVASLVGINLRPAEDRSFRNVTPKSFPVHRNAVALCAIPERHELWVASSENGVYCHQDGHWYHPPPDDCLPSSEVYCLARDGMARLWVGTREGVVCYSLEQGWQRYGRDQGLEDPYTKVLYWDEQQECMWAGSYGGVLARLDDGGFRSVFRVE